ncbi:putative sterol-4-alpha-carboxylate 3-dehydrogenase, decarboxylating [Lindgomyces ingoldianus]|uniref:Sterol-4-alpha-carboxylate 3-dehydrogenase, decarboxylating n=1 Tax=Lindgomyces ingoldianus TaxID=673940 RepID=A0ACB6RH12_9PLEO|nr:putative sterol-4-alpha-carboxylate 3-dehydrogenase, decarboxylating [Lindgomyces ingoldianus]KAF2478406.1 putative sterol-4-alpha-carboxylate 3-dehydrogenase, decarboxylating [Lindgomyces ingoldianus]
MGDLGSVFIIGGCGLLGHHIVKYLLDITSRNDVHTALRKVKANVIINTASPDPLVPVPRLLEEVNINGTQNVLDCAIELGIRVHVYTSSSEVVQRSYDDIIWADETWPLPENPVDGAVYSMTKKIGEELVLQANGKNGLHTAALRLCTIFGEGDRVLTRHAIEMAQDGRAKYHVGTGKNLYDFIYAGNAAEGHILAAKKLLDECNAKAAISSASQVSGEAFFLTNGDPWPFWAFSRTVAEKIGKPIADKDIWTIPLGVVCLFVKVLEWMTWVLTLGGQPSITTNMLKYTAQVRTFSIEKAKQRLGYQPRVGMEEGIQRAVTWHLSNSAKAKKLS